MFSHITGSNSFPKPLSAEEERHYLEQYENGGIEAKNILIERNLRLVAHIAKKYSNYNKENEDLISIGTIGLIKAITTFKTGKGTRLATYAARCIENEILMSIRASKKYSGDVSLQDTIGVDREGNEVCIEDKIADDKDSIDDQVSLKLQIKTLYEKMKKVLKGREIIVIELRYGLASGCEKTQREIADMLGISRSYVSRIEKKALKKLNKEMLE
jgi:RNA polymerase sporulation-specific sigma factor